MDQPLTPRKGSQNRWDGPNTNGSLPTPSPTPSPAPESPTLITGNVVGNGILSDRLSNFGVATSTNGTADPSSSSVSSLADRDGKRKRSIDSIKPPSASNSEADKVLKLSPAKIQELTESPASLPIRQATPLPDELGPALPPLPELQELQVPQEKRDAKVVKNVDFERRLRDKQQPPNGSMGRRASFGKPMTNLKSTQKDDEASAETTGTSTKPRRPDLSSRAVSTPVISRRKQSSASRQRGIGQEQSDEGAGKPSKPLPPSLSLRDSKNNDGTSPGLKPSPLPESRKSPIPSSLPLPPLSLPTYLQLELSTERPSPLYIHRSSNIDTPYESSKVKLERLRDFLSLAFYIEPFLCFGFFTCLDAWLYLFTILPLRFVNSVWILLNWWVYRFGKEVKDIAGFIYWGIGRVWRRRRGQESATAPATPSAELSRSRRPSVSTQANGTVRENGVNQHAFEEQVRRHKSRFGYRHRRSKSTPSTLKSSHKADLLRGLLVVSACAVLMRYDASRMYHSIRGQAAIKLYVIYNVLEVGDRLLSALGQDVLECLFSDETLERDTYGRSKIIRPFWMFVLALGYVVVHATALFYQVITLNVAVNSYSNALLTLLMSNQFVEIKSTVFKKIEKENLFQLACADVVERFQLWLMLLIIAMRNIIEVGGLSISLSSAMGPITADAVNTTTTSSTFGSIIPKAFTILPSWIGQVLGPFLIVFCSEMAVDWIKHAYTCKFNNVKSNIYGRFLDVIAKDYYSHAFEEQNLTKRLGLPVLPLACLFIRALVQTYHMFVATHMPPPLPSTATALVVDTTSTTSPATTAALAHIDQIFRRALRRSSLGAGADGVAASGFSWWSMDDIIAFATMAVVFLIFYLLLLTFKLVLGMCLLGFSRRRYKRMEERERQVVDTTGRRIGLWGMTELGEERRKWIYADDPEGLQAMKDRDRKGREKAEKGKMDLDPVERYTMVGKRIW